MINKNIDTITTNSIPNILKAIPKITVQIDSVQSKIPLIIKETQAIQKVTVPNILSEIESVKQQIPDILIRIDSVTANIPAITTSISEVNQTANYAIARVDSINNNIPEIVTTIKTTNDSISNYIREVRSLVDQANDIANSAGRDATKGFLTGVIATPFDITKGIGGFIFGKNTSIKEEDLKALEAKALTFLNKNNDQTETKWANPQTKASGSIIILKSFTRKGRLIKKVKFYIKQHNEDTEKSGIAYFFKKNDGHWSFWK